jgi:hypothetical protein
MRRLYERLVAELPGEFGRFMGLSFAGRTDAILMIPPRSAEA